MNFDIREISLEDIDEVYELEKKYIGDCDKVSIQKTIGSKTLKYYVLLIDKKIIGFFECSIISPDAELYDIVIKDSEQGKGYSKLLLNFFIELSKQNKVETIFLEVNKINNKAITLYEKYGFVKYGERKKYYGENDAVLMKKTLKDK